MSPTPFFPVHSETSPESGTDEYYMSMALEEARLASQEGEVPIGAVLVYQNQILAKNHNRREQNRDPTAHAEILVIQQGAGFFPSWRLEDTTLYVTLEPCPMCAGAIIQARIPRLVYGTDDPKSGAVHSLFQLTTDSRLNHRCQIVAGVLREESAQLLRYFFRKRRGIR